MEEVPESPPGSTPSPIRFIGCFEEFVQESGEIRLPVQWTLGGLALRAFVSPVTFECCIRIYEASALAAALDARRAHGCEERVEVVEVTIRQQGQLIVPKDLLAKVGIQKRLVINGNWDWIELWSDLAWAAVTTQPSPGESLWSRHVKLDPN